MTTILARALPPTLLAAGLLSVPAQAAEIRGRILGDGAKPVGHAVVRFAPDGPGRSTPAQVVRVEAGEDGGFVATGLNGARFSVRVDAAGYAPLTQPEIPAGATVQLRLRRGAQLSGIVRDRATQKPIGGATVLAWDKDAEAFGEESYRKATSGKDGRFVVPDLLAGRSTVEARATGHAPAKLPSVPIPKSDLELSLDIAGGLTGLVIDTSGDPVAAAEVKVTWRGPSGAKSRDVKTGADGRYRIAEVGPLPVTRMTVRAPKFLIAERDGEAPADGVVDFVLEHGGTIAGIVQGFDGKGVASFRVKVRVVRDSSSRSILETEFSDPTGAFRIDDLEPGAYAIEVAADRYASVSKSDLDVAAEQVADAGTLTLTSRSVFRGRVVAARDQTPVSGVTVAISRVDDPDHPAAVGGKSSWSETTSSDGTFATKDLTEGVFEIALAHPQFAPLRTRITFRPDADAPELVLQMFRGGSLTGTVQGAKLDPVPGAHIVAAPGAAGDSRVADTGPDGRYLIDGLAPGTYTVTRQQDSAVGGSGFDTKVATIREGETTTVDFDERPKVQVSGIVKRGETPIPSASIHFVPMDGDTPRPEESAQSDGEGGFQLGLRHGGRYQVSVVFAVEGASNGHNVVTLTIPDQPEVRQDIVFNVQTISGHVFDPERKGVGGAQVTALRYGAPAAGSSRQSTTTTTADGSFRLDAVDSGTYRVTVRARGYTAGESYPVVVGDNQPDPNLEFSLDRGWMMRGRFVDPQGRGVPGALVVVAPEGAAESGFLPASTDATGEFRITAPADGPVSVAAISPSYAPAVQKDVEQPADGDASEVVLHANPGGTLRVRVVHRGGDPVIGAQVDFQPVPLFPGSDVVVDRNRPRTTDAQGTTSVTMLYPGSYLVSVSGQRGVAPVPVTVNEGSESEAVVEVP